MLGILTCAVWAAICVSGLYWAIRAERARKARRDRIARRLLPMPAATPRGWAIAETAPEEDLRAYDLRNLGGTGI